MRCGCETSLRCFTVRIALNEAVVSIAVDRGLSSAAVGSQTASAPSLKGAKISFLLSCRIDNLGVL